MPAQLRRRGGGKTLPQSGSRQGRLDGSCTQKRLKKVERATVGDAIFFFVGLRRNSFDKGTREGGGVRDGIDCLEVLMAG